MRIPSSQSQRSRGTIQWFAATLPVVLLTCSPSLAVAQRKPIRARPPVFEEGAMSDVFVADPTATLKGELPSSQAVLAAANENTPAGAEPTETAASDQGELSWKKMISPTSIEDVIKGAKLRLDQAIKSPSVFNGGGFRSARQEFSLLALMFAVIEEYPSDDVRWKKSASVARERMARAASNAKVGSMQTFNESKQRVLDLGDLVNGSQLSGTARESIDWENLIDRVVVMRLLKWSQQENLAKLVADEAAFESNQDLIRQYADIVAVLGKTTIQDGMLDADDEEYRGYTLDMIKHSRQIELALQTGDAALARQAAAQVGQSCSDCHDVYR